MESLPCFKADYICLSSHERKVWLSFVPFLPECSQRQEGTVPAAVTETPRAYGLAMTWPPPVALQQSQTLLPEDAGPDVPITAEKEIKKFKYSWCPLELRGTRQVQHVGSSCLSHCSRWRKQKIHRKTTKITSAVTTILQAFNLHSYWETLNPNFKTQGIDHMHCGGSAINLLLYFTAVET